MTVRHALLAAVLAMGCARTDLGLDDNQPVDAIDLFFGAAADTNWLSDAGVSATCLGWAEVGSTGGAQLEHPQLTTGPG